MELEVELLLISIVLVVEVYIGVVKLVKRKANTIAQTETNAIIHILLIR